MSKDNDNSEPSIDDIVASIRRIISDEETKTRKPPVMAAARNSDILELTNMLNEDGSVTPLPMAAPRPDSKSDPMPMVPFADSDDDAPIYADKAPINSPRIISRPPPMPASEEKPPPPSAPPPASPPTMRPAVDPGSAPQPPPPSAMSTRVAANMSATNFGTGSGGVTLTPVNSAPPTSVGTSGLVSPQAAGAASAAFDRLAQAALQQSAPPAAAAKPAATPASGPRSVEDLVREMLRPMLQQWMDTNLPVMVERLVQQEIQRLTKR